MTPNRIHSWIVRLAPGCAALAVILVQCSGESSTTTGLDASASGDGTGGGTGNDATAGSSSGGSSGAGSSSGSGGGSSGASSSGNASSGGGDAGGIQDAGGPALCTSPGVPAGCVTCLSDSNCTTATPHCLSGACVQCATSTDCGTGATPVCWPSTHTCHAACGADGGDAGARCTGTTAICDTASGACVGCQSAANCTTARPICDSTTKLCVQCEASSDCGTGATPLCNKTTHTCAACLANSDCTNAATPVCRAAGVGGAAMCVAGCTSSSQCTDAGTMLCDTATAACVQCLANTDCSGTTPLCDTAAGPNSHRCVQCLPARPAMDAGAMGCDGGRMCRATNTCM